jgi:phosphonoacetate hydrolase
MTVPRRRILVVLIDGLGPDYIDCADMPNLKRMAAAGSFRIGKCVIPSVTNVNNASVVTGCFPEEHGIVSNFYYDPRTGESVLMEDSSFLLRPTLFEKAAEAGYKTALVAAKDKICTLLGRGAGLVISAETPPLDLVAAAGPKPELYSAEETNWVFRAARHLLRSGQAEVLYLSTTDYMMHTYAARDAESLEHLHGLDRMLGEIVDDNTGLEVLLTADHGMNLKTEALDPACILQAEGISAEAIPIIRDKRVAHHQNLGGACYVYLHRAADRPHAASILRAVPGIEHVHTCEEAARLFRLRADRIGDLFLLGASHTAFGTLRAAREEIRIRSHGSLHEQAVPLLRYGAPAVTGDPEYNLDLTRLLRLT